MPTPARAPGVYREDVFRAPEFALQTGVPAFLGFARAGPVGEPQRLTLASQFGEVFGAPGAGYLAHAVRGFFENQGSVCRVVRLAETDSPRDALRDGLAALEPLDTIDLVCAPDIMHPRGKTLDPEAVRAMQVALIDHCARCGDRLAILDALPGATPAEVLQQRRGLLRPESSGASAALYYPWLWVSVPRGERAKVPPSGHVAGVYARTDRRVGVHKAPANEELDGVVDLELNVTEAQQGGLHPEGVNCLRVFPGRGLRIWGARTLSDDPAWIHVSVRRLFLTAARWIERTMADVAFEPHDVLLWVRIERELRAYFGGLFRQGALRGATEEEAFYVTCDAETNPPDVREAGAVVTEIGLAPAIPHEFVVVRLIHGPTGVTMVGPARPD